MGGADGGDFGGDPSSGGEGGGGDGLQCAGSVSPEPASVPAPEPRSPSASLGSGQGDGFCGGGGEGGGGEGGGEGDAMILPVTPNRKLRPLALGNWPVHAVQVSPAIPTLSFPDVCGFTSVLLKSIYVS